MIGTSSSCTNSTPLAIPVPPDSADSVVSPDGRWLAFTARENGPTQIWLRDLASGQQRQLTGGNCNSSSPAWELDSRTVLCASDCGHAFGLPALYRAPVAGNEH
ncbi:MAG: hypothetical protein ABSG16_13500 [Candidatus Acidiferrum sp.]